MLGNQILPYSFKDMEVRSVKGDNGKPLFNAKDVCDCLAISNSRDAVKDLNDNEKGVVLTDTLGGKQEMIYVTESGLYLLIFKSRKEEAKEFTRWVTNEVLPSIRKTGGYVDFNRLEEFIGTTMLKLAHGLSLQQNKRRSGAPLSDSEKELIIALYQDMYSINAISRELGCDRSTVSRFLEQEREDRGVA